MKDNVAIEEVKPFISIKPMDFVLHRGGTKYLVIDDTTLLEHNTRPAFSYISMEGRVWERAQDLMQDGRFTLFEPTPEEYKVLLSHFHHHILKLEKSFNLLQKHAPEIIVKRDESAVNAITGYDYGWWCDVSADHLCHYYSNKDGTVTLRNGKQVSVPQGHNARYETYDQCIFCGEPEERK